MPKFVGDIVGGIEILAGVVVGVTLGWTGVGGLYAALLITAGIGQVLVGVGTLIAGSSGGSQSQSGGIAWATRNPVKSWDVIYGCACAGGTMTYLQQDAECRSS